MTIAKLVPAMGLCASVTPPAVTEGTTATATPNPPILRKSLRVNLSLKYLLEAIITPFNYSDVSITEFYFFIFLRWM
jgi:hypothetical protein